MGTYEDLEPVIVFLGVAIVIGLGMLFIAALPYLLIVLLQLFGR